MEAYHLTTTINKFLILLRTLQYRERKRRGKKTLTKFIRMNLQSISPRIPPRKNLRKQSRSTTMRRWPQWRDPRSISHVRKTEISLCDHTRRSWRLKCVGIGSSLGNVISKILAPSLMEHMSSSRRGMSLPTLRRSHVFNFMRPASAPMVIDVNFSIPSFLFMEPKRIGSKELDQSLTHRSSQKTSDFLSRDLLRSRTTFRESQMEASQVSSLTAHCMWMFSLRRSALASEYLKKSVTLRQTMEMNTGCEAEHRTNVI